MYLCPSDSRINLNELKKKMAEKRLMFAEKDTIKYLFRPCEVKDFQITNMFVFSPFSLINYQKKEGLKIGRAHV